MPTNYTGNKDALQSPSPVPGPRVVPVSALALDAEGNTMANLYQAWKVENDFIAHIQSAVGLDVAVLNATGSGFTTPTNTALGGTITPSGSAHIADGTRFIVQIQTGGAVGAATFKTSMDGGNTYGALQTTAASMTDATSGITLAFVGTFTANGTAAFRSAFTPLAQWADQAGNVRSIIDHSGYRRGRTRDLYEDWRALGLGAISGSGATVQAGGLSYTLPTNASLTAQAATSNMPGGGYVSVSTANVTNASTLRLITSPIFGPQTGTSLVIEFDVLMAVASALDWKIGFVNSGSFGAATATGTPSAAEHAFALVKQAADTHWFLETANGAAFTKTDTGITPGTTPGTPDRITMELHGSGSPYGSRQRVFINEALVIDASLTNPPVSTAIGMSFGIFGTTTSGTNSASIAVSPVRAVWNAYTSIPLV